jgi:hypothetical protein
VRTASADHSRCSSPPGSEQTARSSKPSWTASVSLDSTWAGRGGVRTASVQIRRTATARSVATYADAASGTRSGKDRHPLRPTATGLKRRPATRLRPDQVQSQEHRRASDQQAETVPERSHALRQAPIRLSRNSHRGRPAHLVTLVIGETGPSCLTTRHPARPSARQAGSEARSTFGRDLRSLPSMT